MKGQRTGVDGDAGGRYWMKIIEGADERRSIYVQWDDRWMAREMDGRLKGRRTDADETAMISNE